MNTTTIAVKVDFLDVLFEDRNKEYGAYQLRKKYSGNLSLAFLFALTAIALALSIPTIMNLLSKEELIDVRTKHPGVLIFIEPPVDVKNPIKEIIPPAVQPQKAFVAPAITAAEVDPGSQMIATTEIEPWQIIGSFDIDGHGVIGEPVETKIIGDGPSGDEVVVFSEIKPEFPGGEAKMNEWLSENLVYPPYPLGNGIQGTVIVRFVVGKNGQIGEIELLKPNTHFNEEVLRVVKSMPKWKPGRQNGRAVAVWFVLPVVFDLD